MFLYTSKDYTYVLTERNAFEHLTTCYLHLMSFLFNFECHIYKLITDFGLDFNLVGWILDFLTDRTQRVRVNGSLSAPLITSTGTPQGCVLSPLLYILYTNDCMSKHSNRFFLKFADDTVIVSLLENNEMCHGPVVDDFVKWCDDACLQLNVSKTKDIHLKYIDLCNIKWHTTGKIVTLK